MKSLFHTINMQTLREYSITSSLGDNIILNDNLQADTINTSFHIIEKLRKLPVKFSSVITALFCLEGTIDLHLNLKKYHLAKNDMIIITNKQIVEFEKSSENLRFVMIAISKAFNDPLINRTNVIIQQNLLSDHPYSHLSDKETEEILTIYYGIRNKLVAGNIYFLHEIIKGYVHALFFTLFSILISNENKEKQEAQPVSRQQDIYKRFIAAVQEHYIHERKIQFYADGLCITPKYLSQVVYKVSGRFAGEHINSLIILEAKALIKSHKYSMLQISEMLNFTSQTFFGRFFKKATGYTPLQYQNKN